MSMGELRTRMAAVADAIEATLDEALPPAQGSAARLREGMRYATLGGGKRVRPFLVVAGAEMFGVPQVRALRAGAAIELIHSYSLVHDDLPAMDDALTRRGRPSCHWRFDEATAILVGDALQALAVELLADPVTHPDPDVRCTLLARIALAAGPAGMCGGQMIDLEAERRTLTFDQILELQRLKTGALIGFACEAGAILGGAPSEARDALLAYAADLGLAFQIQDDLLDVTGTPEQTGKDLGRDQAAGKATLVALLGIDGARRKLAALRTSANAHLDRIDGDPRLLRAVFEFVISRTS